MALPPTHCPEYEGVFQQFIAEAVESLMEAKDPVYAEIPKETSEFVPESSLDSLQDHPLDSRPLEATAYPSLTKDSIVHSNVEEIGALADELADKFLAQLMPAIFNHISTVCDHTGNVVNANGQELSWDLILDMLDKVDISFDNQGNPKLPTLVLHPEMAERLRDLGPPTPEQEQRKAQILEKKRADHDNGRRSRRLS